MAQVTKDMLIGQLLQLDPNMAGILMASGMGLLMLTSRITTHFAMHRNHAFALFRAGFPRFSVNYIHKNTSRNTTSEQ